MKKNDHKHIDCLNRIFTSLLCVIFVFGLVTKEISGDELRTWHLVNGVSYEGTWDTSLKKQTNSILIQSNKKTYEIKLNDLIPEDRLYVFSLVSEQDPSVIADNDQTLNAPKEDETPLTVTLAEQLKIAGEKAGDHQTLIVNGTQYGFVWCPPGSFFMGSPENEVDRENFETLHKVTLTQGFWILESETTQRLWQDVMNKNVKEEILQNGTSGGEVLDVQEIRYLENHMLGDYFPVFYISWEEANRFCQKLSNASGLNISLPTEAQWEYACRAGTPGPFAILGEEVTYPSANNPQQKITSIRIPDAANYAWFLENSGIDIHSVKSRQPNPWGIYDMHGSVWEMCADRYQKDYYDFSPAEDPMGPSEGIYRVNRGGSWTSYKKFCRSACRYRNTEEYRNNNLGFRFIVIPDTP